MQIVPTLGSKVCKKYLLWVLKSVKSTYFGPSGAPGKSRGISPCLYGQALDSQALPSHLEGRRLRV